MNQAGLERFKEEMKRLAHLTTFEGRIENLERLCRSIPGVLSNRPIEEPPAEHTRAWYAEKILRNIEQVRHHLHRGEGDFAASQAVIVGAWAADAEARLNWPEMRRWREWCESNRESARKRGRDVSEAAYDLARQVKGAAEEYRRKHPYHPRAGSTRGMARDLARKLQRNCNTVRTHLRKLGIR
jgi:hypothetical protein